MLHSATVVNELGLPHHGIDQSDVSSETSSSASDEVMEKGIPLASGDELNQTRLSDVCSTCIVAVHLQKLCLKTDSVCQDYDWRQYASREDTPLSPSSPHTLLHLPTYHHGNSTTPEPDTSTLSVRHMFVMMMSFFIMSSLLQMIDKPAAHSLLDTLDTR